MTDTEALEEMMIRSNASISFISEKIGITNKAFSMKMHNIYIFALSFMMSRHEYLQVLLAETKGNVANTKKIAEYFHVPEMSAIMRGVYLGYLELF